ncbi:hypothetical protein CLAVI_000305 [Candidatus Clavichlamydia salmonicola]|uniref:hypothetical protein n=1 Tax=Candidatus Clavichlamydia salmonicola TaxID=469812 RepID=UPI001891E5D8|nr:hypothetical protein [Candidatus Clavichlamydia salmonicola]MBF5050690.1 hypothetical protein [Candidatus Clavichlamydia salmonicola]
MSVSSSTGAFLCYFFINVLDISAVLTTTFLVIEFWQKLLGKKFQHKCSQLIYRGLLGMGNDFTWVNLDQKENVINGL